VVGVESEYLLWTPLHWAAAALQAERSARFEPYRASC
jgi:hypothetical protein